MAVVGIRFGSVSSDSLCMLAILSLDVRPSAVCVHKVNGATFDIEVLRSEVLGKNFEWYSSRFQEILKVSFAGTELGEVSINLTVVDELKYQFEEAKVWEIAKNPLVVGK